MRQSEIEVESEEWDKPWSIRDFEIGGKIGRGQYGKVYSVRERRTGLGLIFALKVMKLDKITEDSSEQNIMREINIHQQLYHENVIKFHGYFFDEKNISFILEYAECCLFSKMFNEKNEHVLKEPDAAKYAYQVIKALEYIHSKGVVHRDIKPENILIGVDGQIKITDFGWAKRITDETQDIVELNASVAGTLAYLCPEMFEADIKYDGYKVDNWCVGILVYEMVFGKTPFEEKDRKRDRFDYPTGKRVNRQCKELISGLLKVDPDDRAELIDALKNKWLSKPTNC